MLQSLVKVDLKFHPFHLVDVRPWPIFLRFSLLFSASITLCWINGLYSFYILIIRIVVSSLIVSFWWRDVTREATFQGKHTIEVIAGLRLGMLMFIASEVMFFFSFFYALFFLSLRPDVSLGLLYPPVGVSPVGVLGVPLLNSILLLSSGVSITWAHYELLRKNISSRLIGLLITLILGLVFLTFQAVEYKTSSFTMADRSFGSVFFLITGFHGAHVCVGVVFITIRTIRLYLNHYNNNHHLGLELAAWYWHFVDVVWLFLYLTLYWWLS